MPVTFVSPLIPEDLELGVKAIDRKDVEVMGPVSWHAALSKWILRIKLSPSDLAYSHFVPFETEWYVHVDQLYPFGEINFFPAKGGIHHTFPHQALNLEGPKEEAWRRGKVCLGDAFAIFNDQFLSIEPFSATDRLSWHIGRAVEWLGAASRNKLFVPGNYFELPQFPVSSTPYSLIAYAETPETFKRWKEIPNTYGFFEYSISPFDSGILIVRKMLGQSRNILVGTDYGRYVGTLPISKKVGVWLRLASMPIVPPWQVPLTWRELEACLQEQGVDFRSILDICFASQKKQKRISNVALIGFPIPDRIGEDLERMHWQAISLPSFNFRNSKISGFSPSFETASRANREVLRSSTDIKWVSTENWAPDQITSRGSLPLELIRKKVLVIGAGAIGSTIAEMLVRGGHNNLTLCDGDEVEMGNLVRHTLDFRHLGQNKAAALAGHLNQTSPWADVRYLSRSFSVESLAGINDFNLVLDCSASQKTLRTLAECQLDKGIDFITISTSFAAKRLYFFSARGRQFPFNEYRDAIIPWMQRDSEENQGSPVAREGIGCWHPVFPARSDEMWLWGSTAIRSLINVIEGTSENFKVFEQGNGKTVGQISRATNN